MPLLFIDAETRSELDINEVGAYKYLSHSSTKLLMIAYAFGNEEIKLWECHKGPIPEDLRQGLEDDFQILVAWNCNFERLMLRNQLGIEIPIDRWEDAMIRSRYMSLPGSLEKVGKILNIESKKLTEFFVKDESMVDLFCTPLRMGGEITLFGVEPTTYRDQTTHWKEWQKFCDYCCIDVEAMREIHNRLTNFPLPDSEYELFEVSEEINDRGVYTDSVLLQGAGIIVEKEQEALYKEWIELTGIKKPKSTKMVLAFVKQHGYTFPSIGKPFVNRALAGECNLDELGTKVLKLRLQLSKSSIAKLEACRDSVEPDGRVRGLFNFMGAARTARWTSGLLQAHNLVKATKEVEKKQELALELIKAGDYDRIKKEFSSPIDVACSALRPILRAPQGRTLFIADLNAIETRGAAWIAGCDTLMEVFRLGRDPYLAFAAQMDPSKTYEQLYAEYKAGDKTARTNAKSPTLGCFGRNTKVLTNAGIKKIIDVGVEDKVWDGVEWVQHSGVVYQGDKQVIDLCGVEVTPEHLILCGDEWKESWEVNQNILLENRAINLATGLLAAEICENFLMEKEHFTIYAPVLYAKRNSGYTETISKPGNLPAVIHALGKKLSKNVTESTNVLTSLEHSLIGLRTDIMQFYRVVEELANQHIGTLVGELNVDSRMYMNLLSIASLLKTTTSLAIRLIEEIITGITNQEISDSYLRLRMGEIKSLLDLLNTKEKNFPQSNSGRNFVQYIEILQQYVEKLLEEFLRSKLLLSNLIAVESTFDILNAGPRNRFTILTDRGPMIVHNCGYSLSAGMIYRDKDGNIVKTGLLGYADAIGIELSPEYAEKAVNVYRNSYPEIVNFWYDLHRAYTDVVERDIVVELGPLRLDKTGRVLNMWLPSGRALHYINPRTEHVMKESVRTGRKYKAVNLYCEGIHQETHQWCEIETRGGKLFENATQAICRDVLGCGMINARDKGFDLVLHCHDELVAEVPEDSELSIDDFIECMVRKLPWAPEFILGAAGFKSPYYIKEA